MLKCDILLGEQFLEVYTMSLKASNKVDTNRYELEIVIDAESFKQAINTVYNREKKTTHWPLSRMRGFY